MTTFATLVLDSGAFLTSLPESGKWDVAYFDSDRSKPSIRIYSDGKELSISPELNTPSRGSILEVQLTEGNRVKKGISVDSSLILNRLTWDKLYGEGKEIDQSKVDGIIRFTSGYFRPSLIKARRFKLYPAPAKASDGEKWIEPVAHNVVVHYTIGDAEELKLVRGGRTLWTSGGHASSASILEIECIADHATAEQYYSHCLKHKGPYWLPNQGDPPPAWPPVK